MKYNVTINGKKYEVEVERADGKDIAAAPAEKATSQNTAPAAAGSEIVRTPMPGSIVDVKVSVGQQVRKNQTLVVLEAMKMENEIVAARDGVVDSISVSKGDNVNAGDPLLSLK